MSNARFEKWHAVNLVYPSLGMPDHIRACYAEIDRLQALLKSSIKSLDEKLFDKDDEISRLKSPSPSLDAELKGARKDGITKNGVCPTCNRETKNGSEYLRIGERTLIWHNCDECDKPEMTKLPGTCPRCTAGDEHLFQTWPDCKYEKICSKCYLKLTGVEP